MLIWNTTDPGQPAAFDDGTTESHAAHQALLDYLTLGPGRTIPALLARYQALPSAPTQSRGTLHKWSWKYEWTARAATHDALQQQALQAAETARSEAILQRGLALQYERIDHLVSLYQKLDTFLLNEDALWVRDIRILRLDDNHTERIELKRFNAALIRQMRGLLDDIASETGGRFGRITSTPQPEKSTLNVDDFSLDVLTPAEQVEFIRLQNKIFSTSGELNA